MSDNDETSAASYFGAVEAVGQSVQSRMRDGEDESDVLHAEIDGSWWVIYTHAAVAVLLHSSNDDAIFEEMGDDALSGCTCMSAVYTRAAFYAMSADVRDWMSRNPPDEDEGDAEQVQAFHGGAE